jgi:hypothetical protein
LRTCNGAYCSQRQGHPMAVGTFFILALSSMNASSGRPCFSSTMVPKGTDRLMPQVGLYNAFQITATRRLTRHEKTSSSVSLWIADNTPECAGRERLLLAARYTVASA